MIDLPDPAPPPERDHRGRFVRNNRIASQGGRARAAALTPQRRRAIARRGWRALVRRHFGDNYRAIAVTAAQSASAPTTIFANGSDTRAHQDALGVADATADAQRILATERDHHDPLPPAAVTLDRTPAALQWPTLDDVSLDDVSLDIVHELDAGSRTWRSVEPTDRRVITLAAIKEMCDISPEQLGILRFDEWRPAWMPKFNTLTAQLGMTWVQMRLAAQEAF